jgi:hypothetical protein
MWNETTIPKYQSDRVTVSFTYDPSDRRHQTHYCHLNIDGETVTSKSWYEDDDFDSNSEEKPNTADMWDNWIKSLKLNPKDFR